MTKRKLTECPFEPFAEMPDPYMVAWMRINPPPQTDEIERATNEFHAFIDHHLANGSQFKDWLAAWRTWCRNSVKWAKEGNGKRSNVPKEGRIRVSGHGVLEKALIAGDEVALMPGAYSAPAQLTDWVAVAHWYNDLASREGWKGRVVEVVKANGWVERV